MALRYSEAEKGKKQMVEETANKIKRIRAPSLDTTALIKENALTVLGRLTNPREQRIWALLPGLPRKWNLLGRAEGSDLGNNVCQYRFDREEDLRRVLENGPYQFDNWMVILQRWEPVISASFPSQISFWIRIKGLPLHYWLDDMVYRVGQELTYVTHELTKTTARVRVLVDGLKPLLKESIVEFDSGEESNITFEYEKLEMHCSVCYSLLHSRKLCPQRTEETSVRPERPLQRPEARNDTRERSSRRENTNVRDLVNPSKIGLHQERSSPASKPLEQDTYRAADQPSFNERVDRYGRSFGDRVGTKQTRNPPPPRVKPAEKQPDTDTELSSRGRDQGYESPQYSKNRKYTGRTSQRGKDLFPRRSEGQWRPKLTAEPNLSENRGVVNTATPTPVVVPNTEQDCREVNQKALEESILDQLNEATRQYLSCSDPKEAAARRQRVHFTDTLGLTEEATAVRMAADIAQENETHTLMLELNPVTPPPLRSSPAQFLLPPAPVRNLNQRENAQHDLDRELVEEIASPTPLAESQEPSKSLRLKSVIVSPPCESECPETELQNQTLQVEEEETLQTFQNRIVRRVKRTSRRTPVRSTPGIIIGTSLKKRKLSQI